MVKLLGGFDSQGVTITQGQYLALQKLYGYHKEEPDPNWKAPPPPPPRKAWEAPRRPLPEPKNDGHIMLQAGADRNMFREAERDGLRIVAWLAKHADPGEDPLKTVVQMAIESGWDVDPEDVDWIEE
jgi:hypothetical protein